MAEGDSPFIVTPRYEKWLAAGGADEPVPGAILKEVTDGLRTGHVSSGRRAFHPTSVGKCGRRQVLNYLRLPKSGEPDNGLRRIFDDGMWRHLRWQCRLRQSKVLDRIEVRVWEPVLKISARFDGAGRVPGDHSNRRWRRKRFALELKGENSFVYARSTWYDYRHQVYAGFLGDPRLMIYVVLLENKNTQEYREIVVERDDLEVKEGLDDTRRRLIALNTLAHRRVLPPLLDECEAGVGEIFKKCPYGGVDGTCHKYKNKKWVTDE